MEFHQALLALRAFPLRALALGNTNAKCKDRYLTFQASKCIASGNDIAKYCKFFSIVLQCNSIFRIAL